LKFVHLLGIQTAKFYVINGKELPTGARKQATFAYVNMRRQCLSDAGLNCFTLLDARKESIVPAGTANGHVVNAKTEQILVRLLTGRNNSQY